jgi:hypothetical protein
MASYLRGRGRGRGTVRADPAAPSDLARPGALAGTELGEEDTHQPSVGRHREKETTNDRQAPPPAAGGRSAEVGPAPGESQGSNDDVSTEHHSLHLT